MKKLFSLIFSAVLAATAFALPQQKAKITVSGYNWENAGELENFPVLVRISESRISGFYYDSCKEGGADISFALEDGTLLPHEIDTWNTLGESLVWVKLPKLVKDTTFFYLRWKDSAPPQNTPTDVWSSNYIGVWHMNSLNANRAVHDATGNGYDAALRGEGEIPQPQDASKIGAVFKNGDNLDENNAAIPGGLSVANYEPEFPGSEAAFTCSAWVYLPEANISANNNHTLMSTKAAWDADTGWLVLLWGKESSIYLFGQGGLAGIQSWGVKENGGASSFKKKWVYVTVTRSNGTSYLYVNGSLHHASGSTKAVKSSTEPLVLMTTKNTYMDECRLRNGGSTYDWIKAEYRTMADEAFLTYGEAEVSVVAENILVIDGSPNRFGTPTPGYGVVADLSPDSECNLSMSETEISVEGTSAKYCLKGWKLEKVEPLTGEVTLTKEYTPNSDDSLTSYTYTHSSMSRFTWLWEYRDELNLKNFNLQENGGTFAKFSVDVTGLGYSGKTASLKICYGLSSDEFLWEYDAGAVESIGVKEVTVPNLTPGVYYYMKAKIVGDSVVETTPLQVQMNEVEGASSPVSNLVLDGSGATTLSLSGSLDLLSGASASITVLVGVSPEKMTSVWGELSGSQLTSAGTFQLTLNADFEDEKYLAPGMTYYVQLLVKYSDGSAVVTTPTSVTMSKLTGGRWTYVETTTNADGSGAGTISDGIWKLYASRSKDVNELFVNASSGVLATSVAQSSMPLSIDFTAGAIDGNDNIYQIVSFSNFSWEKDDGTNKLRKYKDRLVEFIAPDCRSIPIQGTFLGCTKLTNVILKAGVTLGQKNIFNACYSLRNISPRVFKELPWSTFVGCNSLEGRIELTDQINTFDNFNGCAKIEEIIAPKITTVSANAFKGCASVTNITLSSSVVTIGAAAFSGCSKLDADITKFITPKLTSLGQQAFSGCACLKGDLVWKSETLTSLPNEVFNGCRGIKSITFKTPITSISTSSLLGLAPSSQIYFDCPAPTSFGERGIMNNTPYTRVYLTKDFDNWLTVMSSHKNNYVAWKNEFSTLSTTSVAGKRMLQDPSMCVTVDGKLKVLDKKVIGFLYWEKGYGCWILKAPQTGFSVIVR